MWTAILAALSSVSKLFSGAFEWLKLKTAQTQQTEQQDLGARSYELDSLKATQRTTVKAAEAKRTALDQPDDPGVHPYDADEEA